MKHFEIVYYKSSELDRPTYRIICDGYQVGSGLDYHQAYQKLAQMMSPQDTFQEIEGDFESAIFSYGSLWQTHMLSLWMWHGVPVSPEIKFCYCQPQRKYHLWSMWLGFNLGWLALILAYLFCLLVVY